MAFTYRGVLAQLNTQYVSKQYMTNAEIDALSLPRYCVSNLNFRYVLPLRTLRSIEFGLALNNLFNAKYISNGYGYSSIAGGTRYDSAYYFPQATFNVMGSVTV